MRTGRSIEAQQHLGVKDGLKLLGIQGKESAWFSFYLSGSKQTVEKEHIEELPEEVKGKSYVLPKLSQQI